MKLVRGMMTLITKRRLQYLGHVIRGDRLQAHLLEGISEGKRGRGRLRGSWLSDMVEITGLCFEQLKRIAGDREDWRAMIANIRTADMAH